MKKIALALTLSLLACTAPAPGAEDGAAPADAAMMAAADLAPSAFTLTSSAFTDRGTLPVDYTCDGAGRSPPLAWTGAPNSTVEYALLMTTLAKDGLKWNWVLWGIPAGVAALPDNSMGIGTAGLTSDGPKLAYSPPCSKGPGLMTYTFTLYALSAKPVLPAQPGQVTGQVLTDAIAGITIGKAVINVGYTR